MFSNPDCLSRLARTGLLASLLSLAAAVLSACSAGPSSHAEAAVGRAAAPAPVLADRAGPAQPSQAETPTKDAAERMLAYADRLRQLPAADINQEVARLGEASTSPTSPTAQLQLALALSQLRQLPELIRAQELLTRLLANPEAQALHPLARLLAARYGEQRRLEEQLDKQAQQLRELQRRLDQTNDRLEALKAIERSLTSRPAASAPAPARRTRPATP
ncbi:hypothetical protein SAMN05216344_107102 [Polaromonas sp. OV174]|uniref:hypothetical protein n=1 Tax=Polaromonas sp. OV174 TaxID=1855300 RepID=UPI0008E520BB|nr:hypothetical protein [Polaromonas sp. OV174]SFC02184.1 hypothetical protein SAMN05216344_107102 [Polaromonas sp. OV174]